MMELRAYQEQSVSAIFAYFEASNGNPLIVLPTGAGKSLVMAEFIRRACSWYPDTRVLLLSHVKELLTQNAAALLRQWPEAPLSMYSAGLNARDLSGQIIIGGIQSIHRKAHSVQVCDLVLIDEAHLLTPSDAGMYRRFLKDLAALNPHLKIVGLTATPFRMDTGMLHRGPHALFTDIAHEVKLSWLIDEGYLSPLRCKQTDLTMDVSKVQKRGGEFIASMLEAAVDKEEINEAVVMELLEKGKDRGSWLLFCSGIKHAEHLASLIRAAGIRTETVFGDTPPAERSRVIEAFKRGEIRCIANVGVLTTGFDAPGVDLIGMLRPTMSKGLYVQMCGRGTRLAEGKDDCLVLDWAGNVTRHGPVDLIKVSEKEIKEDDEKGQAPVKPCPDCQEIVAASARKCPACGHEFPAPEVKLAFKPVNAAILSRELRDEWLAVTDVDYARHTKLGSPDSLRVTYHCGLNTYREWVCLEHTGYAREKAVRWWARRMPGQPAPSSIDEALDAQADLPMPKAIMVRPAGQYWEIQQVRFS